MSYRGQSSWSRVHPVIVRVPPPRSARLRRLGDSEISDRGTRRRSRSRRKSPRSNLACPDSLTGRMPAPRQRPLEHRSTRQSRSWAGPRGVLGLRTDDPPDNDVEVECGLGSEALGDERAVNHRAAVQPCMSENVTQGQRPAKPEVMSLMKSEARTGARLSREIVKTCG